MAPSRIADRPVKPRRDISDEEYVSDEAVAEQLTDGLEDEERSESDDHGANTGTDTDSQDDDDDDSAHETDMPSRPSVSSAPDLKSISFGALAAAAASFPPPRSLKRKHSSLQSSSTSKDASKRISTDNPHPTHTHLSLKPTQDLTHRTSKHAPTILSSRHPVSRTRAILSPPPAVKHRDPRFDPTITSHSLPSSDPSTSKAYSFLTTYQTSELLSLKSQIKALGTTDPSRTAALKAQAMSMESRLRNAERANKEREVLQRHRREERAKIAEGTKGKAYYLKKSQVRKEVEKERIEGMGKRQRETMEKRRRAREKKKEARDMPWERRMG